MEELQDAIEDAQYVNAINTQDDGPKPVLAWETPASEYQMEDWANTKRWDLDSFLESAIGFFLFSQYIKTTHNDYVRMNFCEDVIRFQKLRGRSRRKQAQYILEHYLSKRTGTGSTDGDHDNSEGAPNRKMPPRTEIEECDLERRVGTGVSNTLGQNGRLAGSNGGAPGTSMRQSSLAYLKEDATFRIYCDYPKCTATVVGLRDAILEDLVDDWREWEESERRIAAAQQAAAAHASPNRHPERKHSTGSGGSGGNRRGSANSDTHRTPSKGGGSDGGSASREGSARRTSSHSSANKEGDQPAKQPQNEEQQEQAEASAESPSKQTAQTETSADTPSKPPQQQDDASGKTENTTLQTIERDSASAPLTPSAAAPPPPALQKQVSAPSPAPPASSSGTKNKVSSTPAEDEVRSSMRILTHKFKTQQQNSASLMGGSDVTLFDKAETVVMESLRRDYWELFLQSPEFARAKNFMWYQDRPVVPDDFYIMRVLGRGGFGLVNACKKGTSGKLYAMKMMNKRRIKMKKSEQLAMNERSALAAVESNFVVNLKYSFHSRDDVYLILDLMTGGDLGFHLHQKGRFPKREVQYYAARILLGLQALHDQGYVYRDLKPENCLMAEDGRVKITDLGLATKIIPTLHGAAGTRGYWAPEMLRRDKRGKRMPYGHTVDWFSFGCCVTEFICGANPFRSEAALNFGLARGKQTKEKAIDCATLEMEPDFPKEFFETDARDLCTRLLEKDETIRLGTGGCEEIMAHPYFKNVNWEAILSDRKRPPFVPAKDVNAASQSEIGNFVEDKTYQDTHLTDHDEAFYRHWDWTNPRAYATEVIEFLIYERETGEPLLPIQQNGGCCCSVL